MSHFDDIGNLFRRFGGNPADYHEVAIEDETSLARQRWPLLWALTANAQGNVPTTSQTSGEVPVGQAAIRADAIARHDKPARSRGLRQFITRALQPAPAAPKAPDVQAAASRFSARPGTLDETGLQTPAPKSDPIAPVIAAVTTPMIAAVTAPVSSRMPASMQGMSPAPFPIPSTAVPQRASNAALQDLLMRAPADTPLGLDALFRRLESAEAGPSFPLQQSEAGARP